MVGLAGLLFALAICNGEPVSSITIRSHAPSFSGVAAEVSDRASEITGVHFPTTREGVVRAYLLVREGRACSEQEIRESERLLRSMPFISTATIRVFPDGDRVRIRVDVVDEFPVFGSVRVSKSTLSGASLGSQNIGGTGLYGVASVSRGFAYPTGFGVRAVQYGAFGRPAFVSVDLAREQHGDRVVVEGSEPFLTDLQRNAFHLSLGGVSGLRPLRRPVGGEVALFTRRASWDVGAIRRLGTAAPGRTVGMFGAVIMGDDIRTSGDFVIISDTGLIAAPNAALVKRYPATATVRVAALTGVRRIRYFTASGFESINSNEDIGEGVQVGLLAGPSVYASRGAADLFVASDIYAGSGNATSLLTARLVGEVRANRESRRWDAVVASTRIAWYGKPSPEQTMTISVEGAKIRALAFPAQLSFRDAEGGVRGFGNAVASGGQRLVLRAEERLFFPHITSKADLAAAIFADAGKLWAGDAPYGVTSPVRSSLGMSFLAAYPTHSKRTYRIDLAIAMNPEHGGSRFEFRIGSADRTRRVWTEPRDVARSRSGAMSTSLLKW